MLCSQAEEGTLRLRLPALRLAVIPGFPQSSGRLCLDRDSFSHAAQLETLSLTLHKAVSLLPKCFTSLSALATLQLAACDLDKIPLALTALEGSLTNLQLPFNDKLQLAHEDMKTLLTLRELRMLDLHKSSLVDALGDDAATVPHAVRARLQHQLAPWSLRSVQHMADLRSDFLAQHGHSLALEVYDELQDQYADLSEDGHSFGGREQ